MGIMWKAGTTMINANRLGKFDELHRAGTRRDAEFVVEEARLLDELPDSADLSSPIASGVVSGDQQSDAETPHLPERPRLRLGVPTSVVGILALVLLIATLCTGFIALKQNTAAGQWRRHDHSEMTVNSALSADLASAHTTIVFVNSEATRLQGQVRSLQAQLSSAENAKKTLSRGPLLTQLTSESRTVSNELATCVDDTSSLQNEVDNDVSNPSHKDALLEPNTHTASQVCSIVEQDNQRLQLTLRRAG